MECANDDFSDIPEIDFNICAAVQPYQFEPLDSDYSSVSGRGIDSASAESEEKCNDQDSGLDVRVASKSLFDVSTYRVGNTTRVVNLPPMDGDNAKDLKSRSEQCCF